MLYLRNRLADIHRSLESEDWGVALYEMREMARKLRRWEGGDQGSMPVPAPDPQPQLPATAMAERPCE
jgi:hypothetical protein